MTEAEFIEQIDCRFPFERPLKWRALGAKVPRVSANAAFMIIHEVCRLPRSSTATRRQRADILSHLRRRFRHPLWRVIEPAIQASILARPLRESSAAHLMRQVARYRGQFNALAICYFSADDRTGRLDHIYRQVMAEWAKASAGS